MRYKFPACNPLFPKAPVAKFARLSQRMIDKITTGGQCASIPISLTEPTRSDQMVENTLGNILDRGSFNILLAQLDPVIDLQGVQIPVLPTNPDGLQEGVAGPQSQYRHLVRAPATRRI
jgi:hypothetical protein